MRKRRWKQLAVGSLVLAGFVGGSIVGGVAHLTQTASPEQALPEPEVLEVMLPDGSKLEATLHVDATDVRPPEPQARLLARTASGYVRGTLGSRFPSAIEPAGIDARSVSCVPRGTAYSHRLVYAYPSDRPNDVARWVPRIRHAVAYSSEYFHASAMRRWGTGARLRVQCDDAGQMLVDVIRLAETTAQVTGANWGQGFRLISALTSAPTTHVISFLDVPNGWGGIGSGTPDLQPGTGNSQNGFAHAYMYGNADPVVAVHEVGHSMGALKTGTPNGTAGGHCSDGVDIMCRGADGTAGSERFRTLCHIGPFGSRESGELDGEVDCNEDDYFNARPAATSWLATKWNIASGGNRYVDRTPTTAYLAPSIEHVTLESNQLAFVAGDLRGVRRVTATMAGADVTPIERVATPRGGIWALPIDLAAQVPVSVVITVEGASGLRTQRQVTLPAFAMAPPPTTDGGATSPGVQDGGATSPGVQDGGATSPGVQDGRYSIPGVPYPTRASARMLVMSYPRVSAAVLGRSAGRERYSVSLLGPLNGDGVRRQYSTSGSYGARTFRGLVPGRRYRACVRVIVDVIGPARCRELSTPRR